MSGTVNKESKNDDIEVHSGEIDTAAGGMTPVVWSSSDEAKVVRKIDMR